MKKSLLLKCLLAIAVAQSLTGCEGPTDIVAQADMQRDGKCKFGVQGGTGVSGSAGGISYKEERQGDVVRCVIERTTYVKQP